MGHAGGLRAGHHGWVSLTLDDPATEDRWGQVEEWVRISYGLVAPRRLAKMVLEAERDEREVGSETTFP